MIDATQILDAAGLYTRIGLKEPTKASYTGILDATAKTTKSGRTYDFYHSLANFVNIYDCQEDKDISNAAVNILIAGWQKEAIESGINQVFSGKSDLIQNDLLFKNANVFDNAITNSGKFVGFEIELARVDKMVTVLNNVLLQFNG